MMKKTVLASAIALALAGNPVFAATTTVSGQFILDKTTVAAGGSINLAILGLDAEGKVDLFGEKSGSTIMAVVSTNKGEFASNQGSAKPFDAADLSVPLDGSFAAQVRYINLTNGNGQVNISYPATAQGEDTVTVELQERLPTTGSQVEFNTIAKTVKKIQITAADTTPKVLDIWKFMASATDSAGMSDMTYADGIMGQMTAGVDGAQITVKSTKNPNGAGPITLNLREPGEDEPKYTFSQGMLNGEAIFTLNNSVVESGEYFIEATATGAGDSVDLVYADMVTVVSTGVPRALSAQSNKGRILSSTDAALANNGAAIKVYLRDEYGNKTTNRAGGDIKVQLKDTNSVVSVGSITIPSGSKDATLSPAYGLKTGDSSIVATAVDATSAPIATITPSDALAIKVVDKTLSAMPAPNFPTTSILAGTEFDAFTVSTVDSTGAVDAKTLGAITITNTKSGESLSPSPSVVGADQILKSLFKVATSGNEYILSDVAGELAEFVVVAGSGIETAAAADVAVRNAHGGSVTSIAPGSITASSKYVTTIPAVIFQMQDSFGNPKTPQTEAVTGQLRLTSSNGAVAYMGTSTGYNVPGNATDMATVTYDATGPKSFAGEDSISVVFTKPGLASNQTTLITDIPGLQELGAIKTYIEQTDIPVNSKVPLRVETLDKDGEAFNPQGVVTVSYTGTVQPVIKDVATGLTIASGSSMDFRTDYRKVLSVEAGSDEGEFTLTFENANKSIKQELTFNVTNLLEEKCSDSNFSACTQQTTPTCEAVGGVFVGTINGGLHTQPKCVPAPSIPCGGIDPEGNPVTNCGTMGGGFAVNADDDYIRKGDMTFGSLVSIIAQLKVDSAHVGQKAEIVVFAGNRAPQVDGDAPTIWYSLLDTRREDGNANFDVWTQTTFDENDNDNNFTVEDLANLTTFMSVDALQDNHSIPLWEGGVVDGTLEIYFGYRLTEGDEAGTLFYNETQPILIRITNDANPFNTAFKNPDFSN